MRVPVPAGLAVKVTPPFFAVSFSTPALIESIALCPIKTVPLGLMLTPLNVEGVPEQAAS